jgi:hypothetical protein
MLNKIVSFLFIGMVMLIFSGCAQYYVSIPTNNYEKNKSKEVIPVKVIVKQIDWSIVVNQPESVVKIYVSDIIANSEIFKENQNSEEILYVDIEHKNENGFLEMTGAFLTGASLYLIPTSASSDVIITIRSSKGVSNIYKGEMIVSQGFAGNSLIDSNKYIKDKPQSLLKNLIKNAFDEYSNIYMNNFNNDEKLK